MSRHTNSKGSIWKEIKRPSFHFLSFFWGVAFLATLAACGGGSSGGGGGITASSVSGMYSGGTTVSYFHIPSLVDTVYASSSYSPKSFTLALDAGGNFVITDDQGNQGGGTFTASGGTITLSGTLMINNCTPSSTVKCNYFLKSASGGLTSSSGNLSGTIDLYTSSSSTTPLQSQSIGVTYNNFKTIALSSIYGKSFRIATSTSSPNPYNCPQASMSYGTTSISVNGATIYTPCVTGGGYPWNSYHSSNGYQFPTNLAYFINFCSATGTDCEGSGESIPAGDLEFYLSCDSTLSGNQCVPATANAVVGYLIPNSGNQGSILGTMYIPYRDCSNPQMQGVVSVIDSTSSPTGSYFFGVAVQGTLPSSSQCPNGYFTNPVGFTAFSSTQF